jgi:hypothetical protein
MQNSYFRNWRSDHEVQAIGSTGGCEVINRNIFEDLFRSLFTELKNLKPRLRDLPLTSFGHQEGAEVGYNPRYRGKRSYDPLLCVEANSSFLWDVELRRGNAGTWAGSEQLLACCFPLQPG